MSVHRRNNKNKAKQTEILYFFFRSGTGTEWANEEFIFITRECYGEKKIHIPASQLRMKILENEKWFEMKIIDIEFAYGIFIYFINGHIHWPLTCNNRSTQPTVMPMSKQSTFWILEFSAQMREREFILEFDSCILKYTGM